jgi:hypothetical protein
VAKDRPVAGRFRYREFPMDARGFFVVILIVRPHVQNSRIRVALLPLRSARDGELSMLWWKLLLAYCMLVGIGMWFGYRSRRAWPSRDADEVSGPVQRRAGSATGLR